MKQLPVFENVEFPEHVMKLDKALYGLKQAPKAWYKRLFSFLLSHGYKRGIIDNTLILKTRGKNLLIIQVYVDDINFGETTNSLYQEFVDLMCSELSFFLGLQIK